MARSATKQRIAQAQNGANHIGDKERRFFDALKNIFVGVPVEGESGYINLMRIKARYFEKVMEPRLRKEIDNALERFPDFREELFDKLYTFFRRYFTESGSIGFFFTPYHQSVYEQVYTNEQDVVLFWKTARLYYVKTDRLFQSMTVEVDGFRFHFDVSQLEHKRANEKREIIYAYKERQQDGAIVFTVHYSERGRKTKIDDIRRAIRDALGLKHYTDAVPTEETLQRAFRIFERQSEVDYFLCKDAKSFLREQFDLWMWQYLLGKPGEEPQTEWKEPRLAQLQALKRIAYRVIDYIAAFEDELVKIWNKPKFVLNSHYVITLDRIAAQPGGMEMLERLWAHPNMETQLQEWRELGMVSEDFTLEDLLLPPSAASNPQQDLFEVAEARDLITNGYHLPYNPDLVERARELRRNMTPAERQLWEYLKHAPYRFLRQRPIDHFIVDFYCPALRLVIEVDGEQHYTEEGKAYDAERDTILQSYGLRVVRFRNEEVLRHFESVRQRIEAVFESPLTPSLSPLSKGGARVLKSQVLPTPAHAHTPSHHAPSHSAPPTADEPPHTTPPSSPSPSQATPHTPPSNAHHASLPPPTLHTTTDAHDDDPRLSALTRATDRSPDAQAPSPLTPQSSCATHNPTRAAPPTVHTPPHAQRPPPSAAAQLWAATLRRTLSTPQSLPLSPRTPPADALSCAPATPVSTDA
jgi:very-short-patch-repair endonuclease